MRTVRLRIALAVITLGLTAACSATGTRVAEIRPLTDLAPTELPAAFVDGFVFVQGMVNDAPPVWMLLDTGDEASSIDPDYARSLGLVLGHGRAIRGFGDDGGESFETRVARLRIGAAAGHDLPFLAHPMAGITGPDGEPVSVVVGYSFLAGRTLILNYSQKTAVLVRSSGAVRAHDLPMDLRQGLPIVTARVGGQPARLLIDTGGAYRLLLDSKAAVAMGLGAGMESATPVTGTGAAGKALVRVGRGPDLDLGCVRDLEPVTVYAGFGVSDVDAVGAVGKDLLASYTVTFDYGAGIFRLSCDPALDF